MPMYLDQIPGVFFIELRGKESSLSIADLISVLAFVCCTSQLKLPGMSKGLIRANPGVNGLVHHS